MEERRCKVNFGWLAVLGPRRFASEFVDAMSVCPLQARRAGVCKFSGRVSAEGCRG
jgi:hypothetical protein